MRVVYLQKLASFAKDHANARNSLTAWKLLTEKANWKKQQDVLLDFPRAKMIRTNRARFEIAHNTYRLVAHIHYKDGIVEVRFIGTHDEYDAIDPSTV